MSLSHATHENTQEAVIATTLPPLNRIDEKSLDLQQTVNNFCLFYGEISELPSVHEHRYAINKLLEIIAPCVVFR